MASVQCPSPITVQTSKQYKIYKLEIFLVETDGVCRDLPETPVATKVANLSQCFRGKEGKDGDDRVLTRMVMIVMKNAD